MDAEGAKKLAGEEAASWVKPGMVLGLGTGSTVAYAIAAVGRRIREDQLQVRGVPTSSQAALMAHAHRIPLCTLEEVTGGIDLALDGADEVSPALDLIKGRGAAHTREKIVAAQARRFAVLIDPSKLVDRLGTQMPLPVEVLPMAASTVTQRLEQLGAKCTLRMGVRKDGPVVTDQGMWVIDARFDGIDDPHGLGAAINAVPGVLDHGLFVGMATDVIVGRAKGAESRRR